MGRYTARDYDIADRYVKDCLSHFGEMAISKIRSFIELQYYRCNLSFNEYLACLDILKDKENGL